MKEAVPAAATLPPDFGPGGAPPPKWGVAIVGSQSYVTNYNVAVANASLEDGRAAAAAVRSAFGVQVMALPHAADDFEVGCNLQASDDRDSPPVEDVLACVKRNTVMARDAPRTIREPSAAGRDPRPRPADDPRGAPRRCRDPSLEPAPRSIHAAPRGEAREREGQLSRRARSQRRRGHNADRNNQHRYGPGQRNSYLGGQDRIDAAVTWIE